MVVLTAAGCRDDGRTLADAPAPLPTTAPPAVEDVSSTEPVGPFTLASPAVDAEARLDPSVTCDGDGRAPTLTVSGAPPGAAELAIAVVDDTALGYVHWVVTGIPASTALIDGALLARPGVTAATTTGGVVGWEGPCPPDADPHAYTFTIYALAEPLGIDSGGDGAELLGSLGISAFAQSSFTAFYTRAP